MMFGWLRLLRISGSLLMLSISSEVQRDLEMILRLKHQGVQTETNWVDYFDSHLPTRCFLDCCYNSPKTSFVDALKELKRVRELVSEVA